MPSISDDRTSNGQPTAGEQRRRGWKSWLKLVVGWVFVAFGVLGLFLPILQGFLFLVIGFYLLSSESFWVRRRIVLLRRRFPRFAASYDKAESRSRETWGRLRRSVKGVGSKDG